MFGGETRATLTELVQRTKKRDYLQIFSDQFIGKIGEVAFKQYAKEKFNQDIKLDWKIGMERKEFDSDIVNSKKTVSIKATDTLESIWAKTGIGENSDYGIFVKVTLPKDFFIKILSNISSFKKLIDYISSKIKENGDDMASLLEYIEKTAYKEKLNIKAFICGYFKPNKKTLRKKGESLAFIGEVHNDTHMIECIKLKYSKKDWELFFKDAL